MPAGNAATAVGGLPTTLTFVLPYRRFDAPYLLERASEYLEESRVTYRESVKDGYSLIGYPVARQDDSGDGEWEEQPVVDHSLVWRFVGWLGGLVVSLTRARELLLKENPDSLCHRVSGSVDPRKARSLERLQTLETARQLLLIMPEWEGCFGSDFLPRFNTRGSFR